MPLVSLGEIEEAAKRKKECPPCPDCRCTDTFGARSNGRDARYCCSCCGLNWYPHDRTKDQMGKKRKALVAVDLHGTIADKNDQHNGEYDPSAYTLQPGAVEALQELKDDGHEVAIWTCWATEEARQWLDENKVPYDYINEEAPDHGSPKIDARFYVDDKGIRHEGNWEETLETLREEGLDD